MRYHLPDSRSMFSRRYSLNQERHQTMIRGTHQDRHADHFLEEEYEEMPRLSIKQSKPMLARLSVTSPRT